MTQFELDRSVARRIGEHVSLVSRRGFSLVDPELPVQDEDEELEAFLDWDSVDASRNFSVSPLRVSGMV
jgi:hypothetical protein